MKLNFRGFSVKVSIWRTSEKVSKEFQFEPFNFRVLDYTHANCVDHTASRLFYAISAAENYMIFGGDVSNAFSEAPPPKQGFYIQPDRAFREW